MWFQVQGGKFCGLRPPGVPSGFQKYVFICLFFCLFVGNLASYTYMIKSQSFYNCVFVLCVF